MSLLIKNMAKQDPKIIGNLSRGVLIQFLNGYHLERYELLDLKKILKLLNKEVDERLKIQK